MAQLENRNLHVLIDLLFTCQRALGYFSAYGNPLLLPNKKLP